MSPTPEELRAAADAFAKLGRPVRHEKDAVADAVDDLVQAALREGYSAGFIAAEPLDDDDDLDLKLDDELEEDE